jgi:glycosyltransferase involved in cell wall biosynthesis
MRVLVIVPAFNEERSLPLVADDLRRSAPSADICVVDDASTDDTARVARELGLETLRLPVNLGIGGAVQTGYLAALQRDYDVAVQFDGDGQHDAASLGKLLDPVSHGKADLAIGRVPRRGRLSPAGRPPPRDPVPLLDHAPALRHLDRRRDERLSRAARPAIELFEGLVRPTSRPEAVASPARGGARVVEASWRRCG